MRRCLQCGTENLELARFCSSCGNPVVTMQPISTPQSSMPSPKSSFASSQPPIILPKNPFITPQSARNLPENPFAVPQPPGKFPESPFVAASRNPAQPPQQAVPAYAPFVPYAGPPVVPPSASQPKRRGRRRLFASLGGVVLLVLAVVGAFLFLSANGQPHLSIIQGQPTPGQQILLQGEHFPKGSKVSIVVDTALLVSSQRASLLLLASAFIPVSYTEPSGAVYRATVGDDGKFTVKIRIPQAWKAGSQHTIVAQMLSTDAKQVKSVQYQVTIAA